MASTPTTTIPWNEILKIIKFIIEIILEGKSKKFAMGAACSNFGISEEQVTSIFDKHLKK